MTFDISATRTASLLIAVAATLAGCGGGGGGGDQASLAEASETSQQAGVTQVSSSVDHAATVALAADELPAEAAVVATAPVPAPVPVGVEVALQNAAIQSILPIQSTTSDVSQLALASVVQGGPSSAPAEIHAKSGVGVNLTGVKPYSAQIPTVDLMKKASPWMTQCTDKVTCVNFVAPANGFDTLEEAKLDLDADGWVRSLPADDDTGAKYRFVTTKVAEGGVQQAGNYTVVYDGKGAIAYLGAAQKVASQSVTGRDVVSVVANTSPFYLRITATDPSDYIRNIRVYPPGGACQNKLDAYVATPAACSASTGAFVSFEKFPTGYSWHPALLASLKGFRSLRFMDWQMTNATQVVNWIDRVSMTARSWTGPQGVPVEAMFDLASRVGADPWMNIPPHASDAYVHSFAQLAHVRLAAGQTLNLEYGNEMWNTAFPATKWGVAQSQAAFPKQLAGGANPMLVYLNWYAQRLSQVCQIVKSEFGADASRVKCIANTQAGVSGNTDNVLKCVYAQVALGKPCYKIIDAVAIAPYFGYYIGGGTTAGTVSAWTSSPDGGLSSMFQEINGLDLNGLAAAAPLAAVGRQSGGSVAEVKLWMQQTKAVVAKYGLPMLAYEGGQGLIPRSDANVTNLMFAANRDPRMGAAYQQLLTDWKNAGGETFMYFSDVGAYKQSGMWGMRESMFDESNPKWKSAVNWRDNVSCWWTGC